MNDFLIYEGDLEIRARGGGRSMVGRFPYNRTATVRDRGKRRKERVRSRAFGWQLKRFEQLQNEMADAIKNGVAQAQREILEEQLERANVHVLSGHSFDKPLGDMLKGTARFTDSDDALRFEVDLPDEKDMPSYMLDVVKEIRTNRAGGISPGFVIPPRSVVANAEEIIDEPGNPGVQIVVVNHAVLHEMSIVTRPAYGSTDIDIRAVYGTGEPISRRVRRWL